MAAQHSSNRARDFDIDLALKRGVDNLHDLAEWALRHRPRAVARLRRKYKAYANFLCGILERTARR